MSASISHKHSTGKLECIMIELGGSFEMKCKICKIEISPVIVTVGSVVTEYGYCSLSCWIQSVEKRLSKVRRKPQ